MGRNQVSSPPEDELKRTIDAIAANAGAKRVALAFHDYESGRDFVHNGDVWFHAASTIKVPLLIAVLSQVEVGHMDLDARVHVRNRFISAADGRAFRVESARDAEPEIHAQIGKTMRLRQLARAMIITSSNLATNILVDLFGIDSLQSALEELEIEGIEMLRGVEDETAYEEGINNRVTAAGLVTVMRSIEEHEISKDASEVMLEILHDQEFRTGIPAGLPDTARVANKTGEISTVAHDVALVYLPDREPYALAILTEWRPEVTAGRRDTLAALSRAVYEHLVPDVNVD